MANNFKRARVSAADEDEDRLSSLPDDILIYILSLLPTTEAAARTSILARRWRFLWLCVPGLDFSAKVARNRRKLPFDYGVASKYIEWVDRAIGAYRASGPLSHFRIRFPSTKTFSSKIESWLMFSLSKGVGVLDLDCCWELGYVYEFPSFQLHLHPNLRLLKSLSLGGVDITDASLQHLLLECGHIERLQLHELRSLTRVEVGGAVSRLKSVHISRCWRVGSIILSAPTPDLVSFAYPFTTRHLHIELAPRLVDLYINEITHPLNHDFNLISHPLFRYVSQLEDLHLELASSWDLAIHWLRYLPDLSRIRRLKLTLRGGAVVLVQGPELHGLASLIKAASRVQHLTVDVYLGQYYPGRLDMSEEFANLHLELLRVIEIIGYRGREADCALALNLAKGAPSLEKLVMDHRHLRHLRCSSRVYNRTKETIRAWKEVAQELIEPELPSTVELLLI